VEPDGALTAGAPARSPRATTARTARRAPADLTFTLDEATVEALASGKPDWLAADRRAAIALFTSLPSEGNQLYTPYIDLRGAELGDVRLYEEPSGAPDEGTAGALPEGIAGLVDFREDRVVALVVDEASRAAGVRVETLGGLIAADPDAARSLLTSGSALPTDDRFAQLTRAGWNQGVAIRVPAGVRLERPIVVRWSAGAPDRGLLTRTIVELGDGAEASIVEELGSSVRTRDTGSGGGQALFSGTLEVRLGRSADLRVASIQDFGPGQVVFQHRNAVIGEGASLHWALAQLGGRLVRSRVDNRLEGDRSTVEQVEIVFGADDQLFDLTSYTHHVGRDTTGNLLSKGVLLDAARSYMKGMITIEKSARGTDSFLGEFGMNLSKKARSVAIPSLEIDQPDCRRAAHSSSVGPIDETQLFYLESRGIPPDEARKFIVLGFLEPVVTRVPLEAERDRLRELLEAKWNAGVEGAAAA
jgi:Fe-S cluster assembly scaffold protein SufB